MWRFLSRGVRDLRYSPSKQVDPSENVQKPTSLITKKKKCSILDYKKWNAGCFHWSKTTQKSEQSQETRGHKNNIQYQHSLVEAFGWSGAIVLGWYIGQSILRNRKCFFKRDPEEVRRPECKYKNLSELVTKVVLAQPQYKSVLPIESGSSHEFFSDESVSSHTESWDKPVKPYGPITNKENFDKTADELLDVHMELLAEVENVQGLKLLRKQKLNDAISHFKQAVLLNHSSAAFNLAQCYENGWGTEKDLSQAVYYYEIAKKHGHPSAIYNLGVYYSKGWGGLDVDKVQANELFLTAAKLGHAKAAEYTGLVQCPAPSLEDLAKMFEDQNIKSPHPGQIIEALESYMKTNDIMPDEAYHSDEQESSSPQWDSFLKEISGNKTQVKENVHSNSGNVSFVF